MPEPPRPFQSPTVLGMNSKRAVGPAPTPPPRSAPTTALVKLGDHTFEMDKDLNIRPYGDKPTLEQMTMAESLREMGLSHLKQNGGAFTYTPLTGSTLYHGVYTIDPQKWLGQLMETHQPDFTPDDVQPHPTMPGAWIFRNPNDGSYQIYK